MPSCHSVRLETRDLSEGSLELDLRKPSDRDSPPPMREVVFRVVVPEGMPHPQGTLRLDYLETPDAPGHTPIESVPLNNGEVRYNVPVPTKVMGRGQHLTGYWVPAVREVQVPEGEEPLVVELQAIPSGAVYGRVLNHEGSPTGQANLSQVTVEAPPLPEGLRASANDLHVEGPNDRGRFVASPLPLGGVYRFVASSK